MREKEKKEKEGELPFSKKRLLPWIRKTSCYKTLTNMFDRRKNWKEIERERKEEKRE